MAPEDLAMLADAKQETDTELYRQVKWERDYAPIDYFFEGRLLTREPLHPRPERKRNG